MVSCENMIREWIGISEAHFYIAEAARRIAGGGKSIYKHWAHSMCIGSRAVAMPELARE